MTCKIYVNTPKMISILNPISKFLRTPVLFYATDSKQWYGASKRNLPFCHLMERNPVTNSFCTHCDQIADQQCSNQRNVLSYRCHAGLAEVVYPVYIDDNYIGFLIIGQYRTKGFGLEKNYAEQLASLCHTEPGTIYKKYYSHPLTGTEAVEGIKLLAEMICAKLLDEKIFSLEYNQVVKNVENYIDEHINSSLPLKEIAEHVYMNSSYLSTTYKHITGKNITEYIQNRRIATACFLIRTTSNPFSIIAQNTGFSDANYFTKVFKQIMGMTPKYYRKQWKNGCLGFEED